jgi:hypothetical protein
MSERGPTRTVAVVAFVVALGIAAAIWLPRWWEHRLYRQVEAVAGVGASMKDGSVTDARRKVETGNTARAVAQSLGKASFSVRTDGTSVHEIWTYYYANGTLTVNLTDGIVQRLGVNYGPPNIPTSARR